jgi:flagellar hook-associated protein 1 FlgK
MSLSAVVGNALSGLNASQAGLRTASNNVANVNTPGYARTTANLQARSVGGSSMGVEVVGINRVVDQYLQAASMQAISTSGDASALAGALDRLQSQFGNLDDAGSMFSRLNQTFSGLSQATVDPSLSVPRLSAAADLQSFLDESARLSTDIQAQRLEADSRINAVLHRSNEVLNELFQLNASVQSLSATGADTSGAANRQGELLNELSGYMDISTEAKPDGRTIVRTGDGVLLVDNYAADLQYRPAGSGAYQINYGTIVAAAPTTGHGQELDRHIASGELRGLLDLRDEVLPAIALELAEVTSGTADALNAAHNNASSYPAPQSLTGRNTGLEAADLHNFTGKSTMAVTDPTGLLVKRVDVDFDTGTLSVDGGAAVALGTTVGSLTTALNAALGADGTASFTNGILSLSADTAGNGIATLQDPTTPSSRGGRGFSHFFGLNDLVRSDRPGFFDTGMTGTEAHQFAGGTSLNFRVEIIGGGSAVSVNVPIVAGETFNDVVTALNDPLNGLGRYAIYSLDSNGQLTSQPNPGYETFKIASVSDDTLRPGSGLSFSQIFGSGLQARAGRSEIFNVDATIRADGSKLALGQLDINGASVAGDVVLTESDSRGGQALQAARTAGRTFDAAGSLAKSTSSIEDYAARFAGSVGSRAARAESEAGSASVLMETAQNKRADVEGVSLDEELAAMTLFQQSYNASARMLQAARDMTEALMRIV